MEGVKRILVSFLLLYLLSEGLSFKCRNSHERYEGGCYYITSGKVTYDEAVSLCLQYNATLYDAKTQDDLILLRDAINSTIPSEKTFVSINLKRDISEFSFQVSGLTVSDDSELWDENALKEDGRCGGFEKSPEGNLSLSTRLCTENEYSVCYSYGCRDKTSQANESFSIAIFDNNTALMVCEDGYELASGDAQQDLECLGETWDLSSVEECRKVCTENPVFDSNAGLTWAGSGVLSRFAGDVHEYQCSSVDSFYIYDDTNTRHSSVYVQCQDSNEWKFSQPSSLNSTQLTSVKCIHYCSLVGEPTFSNATANFVESEAYKENDEITVTCNDGYEISLDVSEQSAKCFSYGWELMNSTLECKKACTEMLPLTPDMHLNLQPITQRFVGDDATYFCDDYYFLNDSGIVSFTGTCAADGQWESTNDDDPPEACYHVCYFNEPIPQSNATTTYSKGTPYEEGSQIEVICDADYELTLGNKIQTKTCFNTGWQNASLEAPCTRICEMEPVSVLPESNVKLENYTSRFAGDNITYSCIQDTYYTAEYLTSVMATCNSSGEWKYDEQKLQCYYICYWTLPVVQENAISNHDNSSLELYVPDYEIDVTCNEGFEISLENATQKKKCNIDGWAMEEIPCFQICTDPPPSVGLKIIMTPMASRFKDSEVTYTCETGYYLESTVSLTITQTTLAICDGNSYTWTTVRPLDCYELCLEDPPLVDPNSVKTWAGDGSDNRRLEATIQYNCHETMLFKDTRIRNTTITCVKTNWTYVEDECITACFDDPPTYINTIPSNWWNYVSLESEVVDYHCPYGNATALGKYNTTIVCQDGSWVPEDTQFATMEVLHQVFLCEPACPGPPIPPPGFASYNFTVDFREETFISYSCPDYFIDGNTTRYNYCVNNGPIGAWTQDELPECCTQNSIPECILTNLTAEIWWKQGGFEVIFGTEFDDLLVGHLPVYIKPSRDAGFPLKWKLEIPRMDHEEITTEIDPTFEVIFTAGGLIDILISAYTELEGWVPMEVITGFIVSTIENLVISDDGKLTKINEVKTVTIGYDVHTPESCLIINWGDKSPLETYGHKIMCQGKYPNAVYKGLTINPNDYNHTYSKESMYTISVTSFDEKVELKTNLPVVVADLPCDMPGVTITDAAIYFHRPTSYTRSTDFSLESASEIKCNMVVNVIRYWAVFSVDSSTGEETLQIPIKDKLSNWKFTNLQVPPLFMEMGKYKFVFNVIVEATKFINLTKVAFTYIKIVPTPLSPVLIKGSPATVQRGVLQFLDFAPGTLTIDPDEPNVPITNITWFCRQMNESFTMDSRDYPISSTWLTVPEPNVALGRTGGGCFGQGPGRLDLQVNEYTLPMSSFYVKNGQFEVCVVMIKDVRSAKVCVEIEVVEKTPPSVEILCLDVNLCEPRSDGILVNPSNSITFKGQCKDYCSKQLYFAWSVETEQGTVIPIGDPDCGTDSKCEYGYGPNLNSEMLTIHPSLFSLNPRLEIARIRLRVTSADTSERMGFSLMTIIKNKPPDYGKCNMTNTDITALMTEFDIWCLEWGDPEEMPIKFYTFFYNSYNNISGKSSTILANTLNSELTAVLPFGTFEIGVKITDSLDSSTDYIIGNVTTKLPNDDQIENYNLGAIVDVMDGSPIISMYITAYNSINNPREIALLKDIDNSNVTLEESNVVLSSLANERESQLEIIERTPFPTNIEQATVTSDAIASLLDLILVNDMAVYFVDTKIKNKVINLLDRTTYSVMDMVINSVDQISPLIKNTIKCKYAIMKSTNIVLENNNRIPAGDAALASNLDYDVDVGEDMPGSLDEMYLMNALKIIRENTKGQTKQLDSILSKQCEKISKKINKDNVVHISLEAGLSLIISKVNEESLESKSFTLQSQEDPRAAITIPKSFCPSSYFDDISICIDDFEIRLLISDIDTRSYSLNKHYLSKLSRVMSVEIFSAEKLMKIKDQKPPIHLTVPHNFHEVRESRKYVNVSEHLQTEIPLVYHKINVSLPRAALILSIKPSNYQNLVILIDHERYPTPDNHIMKFHIKEFNYNNGEYTLVLNSEKIVKLSGVYILAVGKVNIDYETYINSNISINDLQKEFNSNYEISIYMSACYYFDETVDLWKYDMDLVVTNFNYSHTDCSSTHLTEFGLGFTSLMISTSFSLTFAAIEILGGMSSMVVLAFIFSTFLIILVFAIFKDFGDKKKLAVIPLPDNNIYHEYIYEITFYTGPSSESTCESNIYIILSGEEAETEIRSLPRSKSLYRRYNKDTFVMTVPKSLGRIHSIRIMHDNSGRPPYDSWELEKVVIFDPHVRETFLFEINSVITLDRDDHHIDQKFQTSKFSDKTFSQKFYTNFHNSINEDHIWLSIFQCSPGSRYRSKERVLVAALFMFVSICVSSLFFNYGIQDIEGFSYEVWNLRISILEILIALCSLLCGYPLTLLLSFIFKRTELRKLSECRFLRALEQQQKNQVADMNAPYATRKQFLKTKLSSRSRRKIKPQTYLFPWFVRWISCFVSSIAIGFAIFMTIFISTSWNESIVKKWLASVTIMIFASILVTEWIRILFLTLLSTRKEPFNYQDKDCDEILPQLETRCRSSKLNTNEVQRINLVNGIRKEKVEDVGQYLKDEREMAFATKETLLYCLYLIVLLVIAVDRMDKNAFHMKQHFSASLMREKNSLNSLKILVNTTDDFWLFVTERLLEDIRAQRWYNGQPPFGLRGFLNDKANRIMGFPILRQIRNARFVCHVPEDMHEHIRECSGPHSTATELEDTRDYCAGWSSEVNSTVPCDFNEFKYSSGEELDTFAITGRLATYGSGGYVAQLFGTKSSIKSRLKKLMQYQWIDRKTRAIQLEFSVYNANVNLFCVCRISFEFFEGFIKLKSRFEPVKLLKIGNNVSDQITLICELIFVVATVLFTLNELWEMKQEKCSYFTQYWNIAELTILILSYIEVFLYIYRNMLISSAVEVFNRTKGNQYVRIDYAVLIEQYYHEILAIITFVSLLKLIKLMQFNKEIIVLSRTIKLCWGELSYFFILFAVIYLSFCFLFYLAFFTSLIDYATFPKAVMSTFKMMLGKTKISEMTAVNRFAPIMFFFFSVLNSIMLINIMLAIIINAFETVRTDLEENQLDIVGYMMRKLKQKLLMQPNPVNSVSPDFSLMKAHKAFSEEDDDDRDEKLPTKVNQFLDEVNKLYFDGAMNFNQEAMLLKNQPKSNRGSKYDLFVRDKIHFSE